MNNTRPETIAAFCVGPHGAYKGATTFALWKDADPDIPILKEARAEYGKLQ